MDTTINQGTSFLITNKTGDIISPGAQGFYDGDTRFLSDYRFLIFKKPFKRLSTRLVNAHTSLYYLTNPAFDDIREETIKIRRNQKVSNGLDEDIIITNFNQRAVKLSLKMVAIADFADVFEVKNNEVKEQLKVNSSFIKGKNTAGLIYKNKNFYRETKLIFSKAPSRVLRAGAIWDINLVPRGTFHLHCKITPFKNPIKNSKKNKYQPGELVSIKSNKTKQADTWKKQITSVETNYFELEQAFNQSIDDLAVLRAAGDKESGLPVAGIPWFMTHFGRDSIIIALETLLVAPGIAKNTLLSLSRYQGKVVDNNSEEEPGKIFSQSGLLGFTARKSTSIPIYYGAIDTTILFIILLFHYFNHSGDIDFLNQMKVSLMKALSWIDNYGDKDNDGYIEYKKRGKNSLFNQNWKDLNEAITFSNGLIPKLPIALCEVQGYLYDARIKASYLFKGLGEIVLAKEQESKANQLKVQFNKDFWMADKDFFAVALDEDKKQIDSLSSNVGHLLFSKIVDKDKAKIVATRLLSREFFSGFGIRTLSKNALQYNPMGYHKGSVWPFDNAIIANGFIDYGFITHAQQVIDGMIQASKYFPQRRLPELFCGFDRKETISPINYPNSNIVQAWTAGAIPYMVNSLLRIKINPIDRTYILSPKLPLNVNRLVIKNLKILNENVDLLIERAGSKIKTQFLSEGKLGAKIA